VVLAECNRCGCRAQANLRERGADPLPVHPVTHVNGLGGVFRKRPWRGVIGSLPPSKLPWQAAYPQTSLRAFLRTMAGPCCFAGPMVQIGFYGIDLKKVRLFFIGAVAVRRRTFERGVPNPFGEIIKADPISLLQVPISRPAPLPFSVSLPLSLSIYLSSSPSLSLSFPLAPSLSLSPSLPLSPSHPLSRISLLQEISDLVHPSQSSTCVSLNWRWGQI